METREAFERLRIRLAGDNPHSPSIAPNGPSEPTNMARRRIEALSHLLPMEIVERPEGCFAIREQFYDSEDLMSGWGLGPPSFSGLEMWSGVRDETPLDYVFLDLETTGLDRGAGTYAFMAGLGRFRHEGFTVRQFFLADPSGEQAMLMAVRDEIRSSGVVVSFNGRSFDVPHLYNRFAMNRIRPPNFEPHFDALPPARRIWRRRLSSCSLQSLEQALFEIDREGDIPGWLIPEVYFEYLHRDEFTRLPNVFIHNAKDIVSLAALSTIMAQIGRGWNQAGVTAPEDALSVGLAYARTGKIEDALSCYRYASEVGRREVRCQALSLAAQILRRQERVEEAKVVLRRLAKEPGYYALNALISLAKIAEHRERDYSGALSYAHAAITKLDVIYLRSTESFHTRTSEEIQWRIARLRRKKARQESMVAPSRGTV